MELSYRSFCQVVERNDNSNNYERFLVARKQTRGSFFSFLDLLGFMFGKII